MPRNGTVVYSHYIARFPFTLNSILLRAYPALNPCPETVGISTPTTCWAAGVSRCSGFSPCAKERFWLGFSLSCIKQLNLWSGRNVIPKDDEIIRPTPDVSKRIKLYTEYKLP